MSGSSKTFTVALLCIAILSIIACAPIALMAQGGNSSSNTNTTATPTANVTAAPSPSPSITVTPTPGPLFSKAVWNNDHVTVTVSNNLDEQIQVTAYVNDLSNNNKYIVDPGVTKTLDTPSVNVTSGTILQIGFIAYGANGKELTSDSLRYSLVVPEKGATATPVPQESVILRGTIVDSINQTPVSGAEVIFISSTYGKQYPPVVTDVDGTFTTPKMYPDSYQITVKADGYKTGFGQTPAVDSDKVISPIAIERLQTPSQVPTSTPTTTPSPSPSSPLDSWIALLYNPTVCVGTISSLVAVILGSIGIYDWMMKQRAARKKAEEEKAAKGTAGETKPAEKKDKPAEGEKK